MLMAGKERLFCSDRREEFRSRIAAKKMFSVRAWESRFSPSGAPKEWMLGRLIERVRRL